MNNIFKSIWLIFVCLSMFALISCVKLNFPTPKDYEYTATVLKVLDGDTVKLDNGEILRYIGIDAPEDYPGEDKELFAPIAFEFNKKLVEGKKVTISFDKEKRDHYNRLLGYVFVDLDPQTKGVKGIVFQNKLFINAYMVREGIAYPRRYGENLQWMKIIFKQMTNAMKGKKGMWSEKFSNNRYKS